MRLGLVLLTATLTGCSLVAGFEEGYRVAGIPGPDGSSDVLLDASDPADGRSEGGGNGRDQDPPPKEPRSCLGLAATCGAGEDRNCCARALVPGGTFNRQNDVSFPATVSPFYLDVYEVTVGRFRRFLDAGGGTQASAPAPGAGRHPRVEGSGWDPAWNTQLPTDTAQLRAQLAGCGFYSTWTNTQTANDRRPINCVTWYVAFAFCAWDNGYLSTQAEHNFAAAGGAEQRRFPWGAGTIDASRASYKEDGPRFCNGDGADGCNVTDLIFVGTRPAGNGRWGHADLSGNVSEWLADSWAPFQVPCIDCMQRDDPGRRLCVGGAFDDIPYALETLRHSSSPPQTPFAFSGIRCARPAE
jgi:formylglycine-generating enzyme required for sulfatase activity